jgi:hypothetical protein
MPGEAKLVEEFAAGLQPAIIGDLFNEIVSEMRLSSELLSRKIRRRPCYTL